MIDIHCHILPGLDDGPNGWDQALALARLAIKSGIEALIFTPHLIPGVYEWEIEEGEKIFQVFKRKASHERMNLKLYLSAEVGIFSTLPKRIEQGRVPLMPDNRHLLLESPWLGGRDLLREMVFSILSLGVVPIIAHPERNYVFSDLQYARDLILSKVEFQVDAGSLLGIWGGEIKRTAFQLIDNGLVRYVASDCHGVGNREPVELLMASREIARIWGRETCDRLCSVNPSTLVKL